MFKRRKHFKKILKFFVPKIELKFSIFRVDSHELVPIRNFRKQ